MAVALNDNAIYMPVLRGMKGEFDALATLSPPERAPLLPLIDVPDVRWDFETQHESMSLEDHLSLVSERLPKSWGTDQRVLVDLHYVRPGDKIGRSKHPVTFFHEMLAAQDVNAVPVVAPDRDRDFISAVRSITNATRTGACLRVLIDEQSTSPQQVVADVEHLRSTLQMDREVCDLVLDVRTLISDDFAALAKSVAQTIRLLPHVEGWRTLTLAGSGFPQTLIGIKPQSDGWIPRRELWLWRAVCGEEAVPRTPLFGDYGVGNPNPLEADPRTMRMSANLRYTVDEHWFVLKGRQVKKYGYPQFLELCRKLVSSGYYASPTTSWGDKYIEDCAKGADGPGNGTTWRKLGTSHHLAVVSGQQLSNRRAA